MVLKTLIKKEVLELFKTKKFLVLPIVILFFSLTSPIIAKLMPEIIDSMGTEGMQIIVSEPTMRDAFDQLLNNLNQIGYFVLLFVATSTFISDKTKGRLTLILSKPMKRSHILISKFIVLMSQLIIAVLIGSIFFGIYTFVIFKEFDVIKYLGVMGLYVLYGIFLITLSMLASIIAKSYMMSILISISVFLFSAMFSFMEADFLYILPSKATSLQLFILKDEINSFHFILNIISILVLSFLLVFASIGIFKQQEIE